MKGLARETNNCDASTYFANNNIYLYTAAGENCSCTGVRLDTLEFAFISTAVCGVMLAIGLSAGAVCCSSYRNKTRINLIILKLLKKKSSPDSVDASPPQ